MFRSMAVYWTFLYQSYSDFVISLSVLNAYTLAPNNEKVIVIADLCVKYLTRTFGLVFFLVLYALYYTHIIICMQDTGYIKNS